MIARIYHPAELLPHTRLQLDRQASHHLVRVLRLKAQSTLVQFNGNGMEYEAVISDPSPRHCVVDIGNATACGNESALNITLLQGISRSDRMDASIQKSGLQPHAIP